MAGAVDGRGLAEEVVERHKHILDALGTEVLICPDGRRKPGATYARRWRW
jgi:hypothetical protein